MTDRQTCSYCGNEYPFPVEYHHTDDECVANRLNQIGERWASKEAAQCEDWWYSAVRHVQRNVDLECGYEAASDEDEDDHYMEAHPGKYDGPRYAHAGADIHFLLSLLGVKSDEEAHSSLVQQRAEILKDEFGETSPHLLGDPREW